MVHLRYDNGYYAIEETWIVNEIYPIQTGAFAGSEALVFQLTDSEGNEMSRIRVRDPSIVRGPLLSPEQAASLGLPTPHHITHKKHGSLVLRFPQYRNMRFINLLNPQVGQNPDSSGHFSSKPGEIQQMDLLSY